MSFKSELFVLKKHHGVMMQGITAAQVDKILLDGRAASPWATNMSSMLNLPFPGSFRIQDSVGYDGFLGDKRTEIKTLTKSSGVTFQNSSFKGNGRKCKQENLKGSVAQKEYYIIVDVTTPNWLFVKIEATWLSEQIKEGKLTKSGWTKAKFWKIMNENFNIKIMDGNYRKTGESCQK
jgi:hypothetical protein